MRALLAPVAALSVGFLAQTALAEDLYGRALGERLEFLGDDGALLWDLQASYGGDYRKFVAKTEGITGTDDDEHAELQLLYGHALTPWFDLQAGLRWLDTDSGDRLFGAIGLQGLLPYRVETDVALFVTTGGGPALKAEFERDLYLSETLVLQPRVELNIAFDDLPDVAMQSGIDEASLGLRLRYEINRKFSPYVGLDWRYEQHGDEGSASEASLLAGIRFWF